MLSRSLIHINMFIIYSNNYTGKFITHRYICIFTFAPSHIYSLKNYVHTLMYLHY